MAPPGHSLVQRPLRHSSLPNSSTVLMLPKRSRSPASHHEVTLNKRPKSSTTLSHPQTTDATKEQKRTERERQKAEFKEKYTKAFPSFIFYLDLDNPAVVHDFASRIAQLGGRVDPFFSSKITHFITNRPIPDVALAGDKENNPRSRPHGLLKSPIKLRGRIASEDLDGQNFNPLLKAVGYSKKIWNGAKLDSVLTRLIDTPDSTSALQLESTGSRVSLLLQPRHSLSQLLHSERIYGTLDRDLTQKRHDFRYFSKGSRFVLVEDMRQELATIAAHEYTFQKGKDNSRTPWPVPHCHPQSRGPFIPFDEREKRRWEKMRKAGAEENEVNVRKRKRLTKVTPRKLAETTKSRDMRRCASMNNLYLRAASRADNGAPVLLDQPDYGIHDSGAVSIYPNSGYGGYIAASGNSVVISSTTGNTSTAGYPFRIAHLPSALTDRMKQQVVTSRKFASKTLPEHRITPMGPPADLLGLQPALRKSKSTNTMKLPKREEGSKPGYCESCRVKFDDFTQHIDGRRHRKFAINDANFLQLDCVLSRVRRRTLQEVCDGQKRAEDRRQFYCGAVSASNR